MSESSPSKYVAVGVSGDAKNLAGEVNSEKSDVRT